MAVRKKKKLWMIPACTAAVVVIAGGVLVWNTIRQNETSQTVSETGGTSSSADVVWNGKEYNYNDHLSNFLFMGVDNREKVETETGRADAGQADALYLVSWDWAENTLKLITIPRDTMTRIETFGPGGECLGESTYHIRLS